MPQNDTTHVATASAVRLFEPSSLWLSEPGFLHGAIEAIRAGVVIQKAQQVGDPWGYFKQTTGRGTVGVVMIDGMMTKGATYWGTNTQDVQTALRAAAGDPGVDSILLVVDSPGGYVAGTKELADEVRRIDREVKPVVAYIEDLGASAAYWVASQARLVLANEMAEVGSIGVYAVVYDTSKAAEQAGVGVRVVSSGGLKGAFTDGAAVTDEMVADLQERIDAVAAQFVEQVRSGRKVQARTAQGWADGRVFPAAKAQEMGLIDQVVASREDALGVALKAAIQKKTQKRAEEAIRRLNAVTAETGTTGGGKVEHPARV